MQMPNQVYVYSPDGMDEGWYYENKIPEGWVRQKPEPEEELEPDADEDFNHEENDPQVDRPMDDPVEDEDEE